MTNSGECTNGKTEVDPVGNASHKPHPKIKQDHKIAQRMITEILE